MSSEFDRGELSKSTFDSADKREHQDERQGIGNGFSLPAPGCCGCGSVGWSARQATFGVFSAEAERGVGARCMPWLGFDRMDPVGRVLVDFAITCRTLSGLFTQIGHLMMLNLAFIHVHIHLNQTAIEAVPA